MKKRGRWIVLISLVAAGLAAGCGGQQEPGEPEKDGVTLAVEDDTPKEDSQWYPKGEEIEGQCFSVRLEPVGEAEFLSYWPGEAAGENGDAVFLIQKNGVVWQQLEGVTEDNIRQGMTLKQVEAVSFGDENRDGWDDILIICSYSGQGKDTDYEVRYYEGSSQGNFLLARDQSEAVTNKLEDYTIAAVRAYLATGNGNQNEEPTEDTKDALDTDRQLKLIADGSALWRGGDEYADYSYAVTDLDQNGRLEIVSASIQGTGLFTYVECFEVSEDGTQLDKLSFGASEDEAGPDIIVDTSTVYYDSAEAVYWYGFDDLMRASAAESAVVKTILAKEGDAITVEALASDEISADETSESHTYYDAQGTEITKAEYDGILDQRCAGMEKKTARLSWIGGGSKEIGSYSLDEICKRLERSWEGFEIF